MRKFLCMALAVMLLMALPIGIQQSKADTTPAFTLRVEQGYRSELKTRVVNGVTQYAIHVYLSIDESLAGIDAFQFGVGWNPAKLNYMGFSYGSTSKGNPSKNSNTYMVGDKEYYAYIASSTSSFRYSNDLVVTLYFTIADTVADDEQIGLTVCSSKSGKAEVLEVYYYGTDSSWHSVHYGDSAVTVTDGYIINGEAPLPPYKRGDVNLDGAVTSADAAVILRYTVKLEELSELQLTAGDLNGDGKPDSGDAAKILRWNVKLEVEL